MLLHRGALQQTGPSGDEPKGDLQWLKWLIFVLRRIAETRAIDSPQRAPFQHASSAAPMHLNEAERR